MKINLLKPIFQLDFIKEESYGDLGPSNKDLAIEVISIEKNSNTISSIIWERNTNNKDDTISIARNDLRINTYQYHDNSIKMIRNQLKRQQSRENGSFNDGDRKSFLNDNIAKSKVQVIKKSNYWELLEQCQQKNVKFTDTEFLPNDSSLGSENYVKGQKKYGGWKRISQIVKEPVFVKNFDPTDPIQGEIGNCYLLSSMAALSKKFPNLFEQIFVSHKMNELGIYMARFYVEGVLVEVVVDDYIPIDKKGQPLYAKVTQDNAIWPIILQKAWAKLFKSYQRTEAGRPHEVFYALTGSPYGIKVPEKKVQQKFKEQFIKLYKFQQKGSLFGCSTPRVDKKSNFLKGLASNHAYSVLQLMVDPICLVKLRNPWGHNKGYYYDWRTQLAKFYGSQNAQKIIKDLQSNYGADLFESEKNGIFYMHYDQFMTYFESITVCPIYNSLNILTTRSRFLKNIPKFFYFDLTKQGKLIVTMSQAFKKLEAIKSNDQSPYAISTLILAKQVMKKSPLLIKKDSLGFSESEFSFKQFQSLKVQSEKSLKQLLILESNNQNEQQIHYEFIAARSNSVETAFNFVTIQNQNFLPGRYVIFASANIKSSLMKKDCSITLYTEDCCLPQQTADVEIIFPQNKPKNLLDNIKKLSLKDDIYTKWLEDVFMDKVIRDPRQNRRPLTQFSSQVKMGTIEKGSEKSERSFIPISDSWYVYRTSTIHQYEKMGGYGYFVCRLSQKHPSMESFTFEQREFKKRCIDIINPGVCTINRDGKLRLDVNPGETKILILKINRLLQLNENKEFLSKYPDADVTTSPPLPIKSSISSSDKINIGSQRTMASLSSLPQY